ncbi:protein takeout-like [Thrips palmi]|uniref:Protein takeout-like n=1 Tax=Thrips palmi TaxID=161013 RepID=A0A6P8YCD1_THRPL|nr:protein takeout-like [Thrips palmi]
MTTARNVLCLLATMWVIALALAEHKLPAGWETCKASGANLNKCLQSAITKAVKDLGKGNTDLGIAPLDPLKVGSIHLNRGGNGPLNIDMTFSDAEVSGANLAKLETVRADLAKGRIMMDFKVPTITLVSKYKTRGRVLVIPINGEGRANIRMDNVQIKLNLQGHKQQQGGKDFFNVENVEFDIIPQKTAFKFVNPAHAQQAELLSRVVSENDKSIMQEMRPSIAAAFAKRIKTYVSPVFDIPYDELFPQ